MYGIENFTITNQNGYNLQNLVYKLIMSRPCQRRQRALGEGWQPAEFREVTLLPSSSPGKQSEHLLSAGSCTSAPARNHLCPPSTFTHQHWSLTTSSIYDK